MKIKTKNVGEIVKICNRNGWDINKVKIKPHIMEDIRQPDEYWVELELKVKKK